MLDFNKPSLILDTECTGFSRTADDVTQFSAVLYDKNFNFMGSYNRWINTTKKLSQSVISVTGVNNQKLKILSEGMYFDDLANDPVFVKLMTGGLNIIGHNVSFDKEMLDNNYQRYMNKRTHWAGYFCTMNGSKDILKMPAKSKKFGQYKAPKLSEAVSWLLREGHITKYQLNETLVKHWGSELADFHDSRYDVTCTALLFDTLRKLNAV